MKNFAKITLASLVLAASSNLMADDDIDITANGNDALQIQLGFGNYQDLKVAVVSDEALDANGDITIQANNNLLTQIQGGVDNAQTMSIATVGCDCDH